MIHPDTVFDKPVDLSVDGVLQWCRTYISTQLGLAEDDIDSDALLDELSLDSAMITALSIEIEAWLEADIPLSVFFDNRSLREIAATIAAMSKG